MKRPWTPGPWIHENKMVYKLILEGKREVNQFWADFATQRRFCSTVELEANALLASKAPEMAELLINWVESNFKSGIDFYNEAIALLAEVGYTPEDK